MPLIARGRSPEVTFVRLLHYPLHDPLGPGTVDFHFDAAIAGLEFSTHLLGECGLDRRVPDHRSFLAGGVDQRLIHATGRLDGGRCGGRGWLLSRAAARDKTEGSDCGD